VEGAPHAAVDQAGEGHVEELGDVAADDFVRTGKAELEQGAAAGRQHLSFRTQGDRALVQGADEFRPVMEAQDVVVAKLVQEHPVLDHLHRHANQGQGVLLGQARFAGRIQYADQVAFMVEDRGCGAAQADVPGQIMFVAVHGDRTPFDQAGAHAVGALHALAPDGALGQPGFRGGMGKSGVAEVIEQHAFAVGEHDGVAGAGQLLVQVRHLDLGHRLHVGEARLAFLQFDRGDDLGLGAGTGVELVIVQTSDP